MKRINTGNKQRKVAMCLMAHPDDCEFQAAGTLALLAARGWEIHIVSATAGDCGSATLGPEEIARIRQEENRKSAALLGGHYHCLGLRDLFVVFDHDAITRVLRLTRDIGPTLMFTHSLQDYMLDHEETAKLARSASFGSFVPNTCTGAIRDGAGVPHLYYADPAGTLDYFGNRPVATTYVNVSSVMPTKEKMLKCHASQRAWLQAHYGVDEYIRLLREGGAARGAEIGVKFAEGFRQHRGQGYPKECVLSRELGNLVVTREA
jgi:LmbE family N-acetylglucosaminyl deacetylase